MRAGPRSAFLTIITRIGRRRSPVSQCWDFALNRQELHASNRCWLSVSLAETGRLAEAADLLGGSWARARARMEHGILALRTRNVIFELSTTIASSAWILAQLGESGEALERVLEGQQSGEHLRDGGLVGYFGWIYAALRSASPSAVSTRHGAWPIAQ